MRERTKLSIWEFGLPKSARSGSGSGPCYHVDIFTRRGEKKELPCLGGILILGEDRSLREKLAGLLGLVASEETWRAEQGQPCGSVMWRVAKME